MIARDTAVRKHVHKWKLTARRIEKLERKCEDCKAVQHVRAELATILHTPPSLLAYADEQWTDGALPEPPPPTYGYGPYGGFGP